MVPPPWPEAPNVRVGATRPTAAPAVAVAGVGGAPPDEPVVPDGRPEVTDAGAGLTLKGISAIPVAPSTAVTTTAVATERLGQRPREVVGAVGSGPGPVRCSGTDGRGGPGGRRGPGAVMLAATAAAAASSVAAGG